MAAAFQEWVHRHDFPCLGGKSALSHGQIEIYVADDLTSSRSDAEATKKLQEFASRSTPHSLYLSLVVIYQNTPPLEEADFERYLWERLQAMHEEDARGFEWDPQVSSDAASPRFSMSIGGKSFYVVGLHPNASRAARRFTRAALVFNLHSQFEVLKREGHYEGMCQAIRHRDKEINGDINPMLADHGTRSEAVQYSGRVQDSSWKCPFHAKSQTTT